MRLRQVGVVTRNPGPVEEALRDALGLSLASRYPGIDEYGLGTAFFPIGNEFFEVVWAAQPGTVADRLIDRRGGDCGFVVMIECADGLDACRARATDAGLRMVDASDDRTRGRYVQIHPKDVGGVLLQLCEAPDDGQGRDRPDGPWLYGGPDWRSARRTDIVDGLRAAEVACRSPLETAELWATVLGVGHVGPGALSLRDGQSIRFVAGPGEGLVAVDLSSRREPTTLTIGGLRIALT